MTDTGHSRAIRGERSSIVSFAGHAMTLSMALPERRSWSRCYCVEPARGPRLSSGAMEQVRPTQHVCHLSNGQRVRQLFEPQSAVIDRGQESLSRKTIGFDDSDCKPVQRAKPIKTIRAHCVAVERDASAGTR